jgi:hypothetical protein
MVNIVFLKNNTFIMIPTVQTDVTCERWWVFKSLIDMNPPNKEGKDSMKKFNWYDADIKQQIESIFYWHPYVSRNWRKKIQEK